MLSPGCILRDSKSPFSERVRGTNGHIAGVSIFADTGAHNGLALLWRVLGTSAERLTRPKPGPACCRVAGIATAPLMAVPVWAKPMGA